MHTYPNKTTQELITAFMNAKNGQEIARFLRDLLTPAEIDEFARRFQIAKLLWTSLKSYVEIAKEVGTSTTTVTRVATWLYRESYQGYSVVLKRMFGPSKR